MPSRPANDYDRAIAQYLRGKLAARQITHAAFAQMVDIPLDTMHRYLRGERPMNAGDFIQALAALHLDPDRATAEIREIARST